MYLALKMDIIMKRYSILAQFLLAAGLAVMGKAQVADPVPTSSSDAAGDSSITVSSFLRQFGDKLPSGPPSENTVGVIFVDATSRGWTGEVAFGTDWPSPVPGFERSQNARLEGLSLKKESGKRSVKFGTIGVWGPLSGEQRTGDKNGLVDSVFFDYGGAFGNILGVRVGDSFGTDKLTGTVDAMLGTGDRGLTGNLGGAADPSFCQHNFNACGLVGGVNVDWQTTAIPRLILTTGVTRVDNGGGLYNELRSTADLQYKLKTGPVTWTGLGEYTLGTHYLGEKANLNMKVATIKAEKELGKSFGVRGYVSETHTSGALAKHFVVTGAVLTYNDASNHLAIDFHNEPTVAKHVGATVSWNRTWGTFHIPHR
jgi:hypothetical protein